jgi:hypothetical protein
MNEGNWASGPYIPANPRHYLVPAVPHYTAPTNELSQAHQHYAAVYNPSMTPLKHLTVLQPFETHFGPHGVYAALDKNVALDRLLDENLADVDPFQAAMGLVFLSRLGLDWEY